MGTDLTRAGLVGKVEFRPLMFSREGESACLGDSEDGEDGMGVGIGTGMKRFLGESKYTREGCEFRQHYGANEAVCTAGISLPPESLLTPRPGHSTL